MEEDTTGFPYVGKLQAGGEPATTLGSSLVYEAYFNAINPALYLRFQPMLSAGTASPELELAMLNHSEMKLLLEQAGLSTREMMLM